MTLSFNTSPLLCTTAILYLLSWSQLWKVSCTSLSLDSLRAPCTLWLQGCSTQSSPLPRPPHVLSFGVARECWKCPAWLIITNPYVQQISCLLPTSCRTFKVLLSMKLISISLTTELYLPVESPWSFLWSLCYPNMSTFVRAIMCKSVHLLKWNKYTYLGYFNTSILCTAKSKFRSTLRKMRGERFLNRNSFYFINRKKSKLMYAFWWSENKSTEM